MKDKNPYSVKASYNKRFNLSAVTMQVSSVPGHCFFVRYGCSVLFSNKNMF